MINTIALFIAWGLLVWGAYAIWTLNKNFTSGSQLQAKDLQDMVNKLNEVTNHLNNVTITANTANSRAVNAQNTANSANSLANSACARREERVIGYSGGKIYINWYNYGMVNGKCVVKSSGWEAREK